MPAVARRTREIGVLLSTSLAIRSFGTRTAKQRAPFLFHQDRLRSTPSEARLLSMVTRDYISRAWSRAGPMTLSGLGFSMCG